MISGIVATALFMTVISFVGVRQLCDALGQHGVVVPAWMRAALLLVVVALFMLAPLGAPAANAWR